MSNIQIRSSDARTQGTERYSLQFKQNLELDEQISELGGRARHDNVLAHHQDDVCDLLKGRLTSPNIENESSMVVVPHKTIQSSLLSK